MIHQFHKHLVHIKIVDIANLQIGSMLLSPIENGLSAAEKTHRLLTQSLPNTIIDTRKAGYKTGAAMLFELQPIG